MTDLRPAPMLIADARGLDFLNTVAAPSGSEIEWLADGRDLLAWLECAGLVPTYVAKEMAAGAIPGELDAVAARARALRAWFRGFVLAHAGRPIEASALEELAPLNRLLESDDAYGAIVASEAGAPSPAERRNPDEAPALRWLWRRRWRTRDSLLLPIAQTLSDLVCEADFTRVKQCEGPACTMLFLDTTHRHARRWCSMALCGNRAKQAKHRARAKGVGEG